MARKKATKPKTPSKSRRTKKAATNTFDPDAFVRDVYANPDAQVKRDDDSTSSGSTNKCRQLLGHIFALQSSAAYGQDALNFQFAPKNNNNGQKIGVPLGPLTRLEVGPAFDYEQLWEELEMRNVPLYHHILQNVREQKDTFDSPPETETALDIDTATDAAGNEVVPMDGLLEREENSSSEEEEEAAENDEVDAENDDNYDDESQKKKRRVHFEDDNAEPEEPEDEKSHDESDSSEEKNEGQNQSGKKKKGVASLEDGFFSLADMEAFADEAEELALTGRLVSGGLDDEDADSDQDEDEQLGEDDDGDKARYDQFFAPPTDDKMNEENARALRRATIFDDASEDDESDTEKTPLQLAREKMRGQIEAMEDAAVAKKPWLLRGEVLGSARPKNSALNAEFEHDIALQNRSALAPPTAEEIEFTIRQRVYDGLYDDPVRVLEREYEEKRNKPELPEISQEKPTIGLGELYAEEFAAARAKVSKAAESAGIEEKIEVEEETEEQKEVNKVFRRLCHKLDALSAMHFTPDMPHEIEEMEVKANVPALAAEEAIPEAVSDAALLTPGEVHKADRKASMGDLEKKKTDRKRNRRATKKRLRELNKERTTKEKADEQSDPLLAEKRRAERALERRGKKLKTTPSSDIKKGQFSKSNRFFENLQNDASAGIRAKKNMQLNDRSSEGKGSNSAAQLKL